MPKFIGIVLTLEGRSKKGKERIKQYGDKWEIVDVLEKRGEYDRTLLRVKSLPVTPHSDDRWIRCGHDDDFEIVAF